MSALKPTASPAAAANQSIRATVEKYVSDVVAGRVVAGALVIRAAKRQLFDLKQLARPDVKRDALRWTFDEEAACRVIRFFSILRHWKGEWGPRNGRPGQRFDLQPWQMFLLWVLFGWRRKDGTRRFRTGYIEVGRKNGKTPLIAGIGLYLLTADGEAGAEIYSAATKKDQARIIVTDAAMMVKQSEALRKRCVASGGRYINNIAYPAGASKIEVLAKDSNTQDGFSVSGGLVDELHAHKDRGIWDVLDSGTSARRQPLMLAITTAGSDTETICGEMHDRAEKYLEGFDKPEGLRDETFFAFVAAASKDDDPYVVDTWRKANPNLGVSVKLDDIERKAATARDFAGFRNEFFRKHLNLWTAAQDAWIDLDQWDACKGKFTLDDIVKEGGWECVAGMDLGARNDLTAFVPVFRKDGRYRLLSWFWMPQLTADVRRRKDPHWVPWLERDGQREPLIKVTPGATTDFEFVEARIVELAKRMGTGTAFREIVFDPHNSTQTAVRLRDLFGFNIVEFTQTFPNYNEPCKEFERAIVAGALEHDGNPVLRFMVGNMSLETNSQGLVKPVKPKPNSQKKIDGGVAAIMGVGRFISDREGDGEMMEIPFVVAGAK